MSVNGQHTARASQQSTSSDPTGTVINSRSQNLGEPEVQETKYYDAHGNRVLEGGRILGQGSTGGGTRRIEDVTDEQDKSQDRDK